MGFSLQTPLIGQLNSTEAPKIVSDFATLQTWGNGNIDTTDIKPPFAQSAGINQSGLAVKGAVNIATAQSTTSTTYTTLSTPDQVSGLVLPANGLIAVWYQAAWKESVAQTVQAALFLGANQVQGATLAGPGVEATSITSGGPNVFTPLASFPGGLLSAGASTGYTGDVTTGQVVGTSAGGPCWIFASAGTYTVSVQFRITGGSGGSTTVQGRKLWAQAFSFA